MMAPLFALLLAQVPADVPTLDVGAVVRVTAPQVAPAPIEGRVEISGSDAVWIRPEAGSRVRVPWFSVTGLEVRHRSNGFAVGFVAGALVGGILTLDVLQRELRHDSGPQPAVAIKGELKGVLWGTIGGTAGGLLGAAIGSRFKSDRWESVRLRLTPVVVGGGGAGLGAGVRIAF